MASSKEFIVDKSKGKSLSVACSECGRKTNHSILASAEVIGTDEFSGGYEVHWNSEYQIIQCLGCETLSFRRASQNSEDNPVQTGPDEWEERVDEQLYPSRNEGRAPVKDSHLLPNDVERIYDETLKALNDGGQQVLAGIGIRALIETVSKERNARGNELIQKIDDLVTQGVLTRDGAAILHKLRILGNQAAHEVKPHSNDLLYLAMDVVEHLLQGVYILPYHAQRKFK